MSSTSVSASYAAWDVCSDATFYSAVFYPSGPREQVFQFYFAGPERPETWRPLTAEEGAVECRALAEKLKCAHLLFRRRCNNCCLTVV